MNTISLKYKPVAWLPFTRKITGYFPEEYSNLSAGQFIAVIKLMNGALGENDFISQMTGIPARIIKKLAPFHCYQLLDIFSGFKTEKPHNDFIIKNIVAAGKTFISPKAKLKEMTFGQFIFAESLYEAWVENKTPDDMWRLVASLYIPQKTVFNEKLIDENYLYFSKIKPEITEAVAINWKLITDWLADVYPLVFMKGAETETETPVKKQVNGWIKIFDSLVGDNITDSDRYAELPVNNVLRYMNGKIKENMKRKK